MLNDTGLSLPQTIPDLVAIYQHEIEEVKAAYTQLAKSRDALRAAFDSYMDTIPGIHGTEGTLETVLDNLHRRAWTHIVDVSGIRKVLSIKRAEELDSQLYEHGRYEKREPLPPITVENVMSLLGMFRDNSTDLAVEAVREVFDWLRPNDELKTNDPFMIGPKVILHAVDVGFGKRSWSVNHYRTKNFQALDRVFHILDGKGTPPGYMSPLMDAIQTCGAGGNGSTDYFYFQCYKNNNIHITFRRPDLVAEINRIGGGMEPALRGKRK